MASLEITRNVILYEISAIIIKLFDKNPEEVKENSNLNTDLDLDSLDRIDILSEMESKLGYEDGDLSFTKEEQEAFAKCTTVGELTDFFLEICNDRGKRSIQV